MTDGMLPPFAPLGEPRESDADVAIAYALGWTPGSGPRLHVEEPTLVVDGYSAAALRIGVRTLLVRTDLPEESADVRPVVEAAMRSAGLVVLDEGTLLGVPVALQALGIRLSEWDLWGDDIDAAFACLRAAAIGDQVPPTLGDRRSGELDGLNRARSESPGTTCKVQISGHRLAGGAKGGLL